MVSFTSFCFGYILYPVVILFEEALERSLIEALLSPSSMAGIVFEC